MQQHSQAVGSGAGNTWSSQPQASGEVTGSLPTTQVQQQSLPPISSSGSGSWTPPPSASANQWTPPPSQVVARTEPAPVAVAPSPPPAAASRSGWQTGAQPASQVAAQSVAPPASRMPQRVANAAPAATAAARDTSAWSTPAGSSHTVQSGESIVSIARRYRIAPAELAAANHIGPSDSIRVGQVLSVPGAGATAAVATPASTPTPTPQPVARQRTPDTTTTASLPPTERPRAQPQAPAAPAVAARPAAPQPAPAPAAPAQTQPVQQAQAPAPARPAAAPATAPATQTASAAPAAADTRSLPEPQRMTSTEFRWPVRGRVVTNFGRQPGGGHSDGIAIQVPAGTPVKAAENGVVAYAGSELRGYGNLVLIRHEGDWVTAYAHNSEILVRRGETVRRGQTIARAGQTGAGVTQPQVHFEIRRGSTPVNPADHLTGG